MSLFKRLFKRNNEKHFDWLCSCILDVYKDKKQGKIVIGGDLDGKNLLILCQGSREDAYNIHLMINEYAKAKEKE